MKHITSAEADRLISEQLAEWPMAKGNFEALGGVRVKDLDVDGMHIKVQFNPARIVSSSAKVDAKSLKERKCFLCGANRPEVQRGIEWGLDGKYIVLINPFPIFPRHLTIPDQSHTDQLILGRIEDMMDLAQEYRTKLIDALTSTLFSITVPSAVHRLPTTCTSRPATPISSPSPKLWRTPS